MPIVHTPLKLSLRIFPLFLFFSLSVPTLSQQDPGNLDVSLFRRINNGRSPFLDKFFDINNDIVFPLSVVTPAGFLSYGLLSGNQYETDTGFLTAISEVLSYGIGHGIKQITKRDRPYISLANVHVSNGEASDPYSFPSGHATSAFALATALSLRYPRPVIYIPLHIWALFVSYGRVYLGVHYPSDVLVGGAIGSGTAIAIYLLEDEILKLRTKIFGESGQGGSTLKGATVGFTPVKSGGVIRISYRF